MVKIILCDDNEKELVEYKEKVEAFLDEKNECDYAIRCFSSGTELDFELEDTGRADLYMLDIDMPGVNGLQLAKRIQEVYPNAIVYFLTSHVEYATEGYRVEARRYLLKGGNESYLQEAIEYACVKIEKLHKDCVMFSSYHDTIVIPTSDIMYVIREGRKLVVYTSTKSIFDISENIQSLYKRINRLNFIFINRGTIINIDYVRKTNQNMVVMLDGKELEISRGRAVDTKRVIAQYWEIR